MSEDIPVLIARLRNESGVATRYVEERVALMDEAAETLEAEYNRAEHHAFQEAGLRDDIGNLEAERDALRAVIREALEAGEHTGYSPNKERMMNILSRAIDTKEQS